MCKVIAYASRQHKVHKKNYPTHDLEKATVCFPYRLVQDVHGLAYWGVWLIDSEDGGVIVQNSSKLSLVVDVKEKKDGDSTLVELKKAIAKKSIEAFVPRENGVLRYQGQLCMPNVVGLKVMILSEAHSL
ncbi:uncharacterized protein LOC129871520 [Solanum dulcamara]|uniref:uncharacterized protein LOC129871520 n=1 Tax=Solanum dulcamara TaxID=45834 RepID=UPI00248514A8|nr:uncharacterized protein LOC129871520 [Solanum dulcamara]